MEPLTIRLCHASYGFGLTNMTHNLLIQSSQVISIITTISYAYSFYRFYRILFTVMPIIQRSKSLSEYWVNLPIYYLTKVFGEFPRNYPNIWRLHQMYMNNLKPSLNNTQKSPIHLETIRLKIALQNVIYNYKWKITNLKEIELTPS